VGKKLLVNRYDEGLNVPRSKERTCKRRGYCRWCRAQVRRLAKLASRLILSFRVGVSEGLGGEQCLIQQLFKIEQTRPACPN
jgi:hypothetical protein